MDLKIEIYPKNLELTDRLSDYVNRKVSKLDRFLPDLEEARIDLTNEKSARNPADRQIAQVTLRGKGFILRVEEKADDIFAAIDASVDKMQRKIERFKGKRTHGRGDGTSMAELTAEPVPVDVEDEEAPFIARRKQFTLIPMDELEAIEQMSLLGHENFFIFYNVNSNSINVLYRRHDGAYGLIEPQIG